jgi:hypothetical protein
MLFIPIAGELNKIYKNNEFNKIESVIQNNSLPNKVNLLKNIVVSNQKIATLNNLETDLFDFIKRSTNLSVSILDLSSKYPDVAIQLLRSLYETGVLFRVWIQSITIKNDLNQFLEIGERFRDSAIIEEYSLYKYSNSKELIDLKAKYPYSNKEKSLNSNYDWIKPVFTKQELKHLNKMATPSFRDLIYKSANTDFIYRDNIGLYEDSSSIIHYSGLSKVVLKNISESDVKQYLSIFIKAIVIDYLLLLENLYPLKNKDIEKFNLFSNRLRKSIIKNWT